MSLEIDLASLIIGVITFLLGGITVWGRSLVSKSEARSDIKALTKEVTTLTETAKIDKVGERRRDRRTIYCDSPKIESARYRTSLGAA